MNIFEEINKKLIQEGEFELIPEYHYNKTIWRIARWRKENMITTEDGQLRHILRPAGFYGNIFYKGRKIRNEEELKRHEENVDRLTPKYIDLTDIELTEEKILEIIDSVDLEELIDNSIFDTFSIHHYLNRLKDYKGLTYSEISKGSNFKEKYLEGIFALKGKGQRQPSRDSIIGLIFAFELNYEEANYLLTVAGFNKFRAAKKRDLIILKCLQEKMNITQLNDTLEKYNFKKVGNLEESDAK